MKKHHIEFFFEHNSVFCCGTPALLRIPHPLLSPHPSLLSPCSHFESPLPPVPRVSLLPRRGEQHAKYLSSHPSPSPKETKQCSCQFSYSISAPSCLPACLPEIHGPCPSRTWLVRLFLMSGGSDLLAILARSGSACRLHLSLEGWQVLPQLQ